MEGDDATGDYDSGSGAFPPAPFAPPVTPPPLAPNRTDDSAASWRAVAGGSAAFLACGALLFYLSTCRRRRTEPRPRNARDVMVELPAFAPPPPPRLQTRPKASSLLQTDLHRPLGAHKGRVGLVNLGNTCFMNAALQCLSHTRALTAYFLADDDSSWRADLNHENVLGSGGRLATAYAALLRDLWYGARAAVPPHSFKQALGAFAPLFAGFEQHDAQELTAVLLDGLHEDLNRVVGRKPYFEGMGEVREGEEEERAAARAWGSYLQRDRSVIVDLFQGQLQSTVTCAECHHQSAKFDPFMYLTVPLPPHGAAEGVTLEACLREFMRVEELDPDNLWRCPKCQDFRRATKQFQLWKLPPLLIVHLKRFQPTPDGRHVKRDDHVETPLRALDLVPFVCGASGAADARGNTYHLYALCNHHGTMAQGHYTSHCRDYCRDHGRDASGDGTEQWYAIDDSVCRRLAPEEVVGRSSYLLFFERADGGDGADGADSRIRRQTLSRPELWPFRLSKIPTDFRADFGAALAMHRSSRSPSTLARLEDAEEEEATEEATDAATAV